MPDKVSGGPTKRLKRLPAGKSSLVGRNALTGQFFAVKGRSSGGGYYVKMDDLVPFVRGVATMPKPQRLVADGVEIEGVVLSTVAGRGLDGAVETGYVVRRPDDTLATVLVRDGAEGRTVTVTAIPSGAELMANTPPLADDDREWLDAPAAGREML